MSEEWREIPGWDGHYAVSNLGRAKSLPRKVERRSGVLVSVRGQMLTPFLNHKGYPTLRLKRNRKRHFLTVHRAVLLAFVGPPPPGHVGCHADDNPTNNHLDNLRWDTWSANQWDCVRNGRHGQATKMHCPQGHPYDEENTYHYGGERHCRACSRARAKSRRWAAKGIAS